MLALAPAAKKKKIRNDGKYTCFLQDLQLFGSIFSFRSQAQNCREKAKELGQAGFAQDRGFTSVF